MTTPVLVLVSVLLAAAGLGCSPPVGTAAAAAPPPPAEPAPDHRPASVLDHAKSLPELPVVDGAVAIPLGSDGPMPWRPIREGVAVTGGESLSAAYTRTRGKPAGAAIVVRPGTLAGLGSIALTIEGNRTQTLFLNLKQADGSVWTLGPIEARTGTPREVELRAEDIELDPYQNRGRTTAPAAFDPASVYMLTILDISGFMSIGEPECEWTVSSLKAVRP